jgi:hypothetical protein
MAQRSQSGGHNPHWQIVQRSKALQQSTGKSKCGDEFSWTILDPSDNKLTRSLRPV